MEAVPGDYTALRVKDKKIFFISHDFNKETEESHYEIAESLDKYLLGLSLKAADEKSSFEDDLIEEWFACDF